MMPAIAIMRALNGETDNTTDSYRDWYGVDSYRVDGE